MNKETALKVIIEAVKVAQSRGSFTLEEAETVALAKKSLEKEETTEQPGEVEILPEQPKE